MGRGIGPLLVTLSSLELTALLGLDHMLLIVVRRGWVIICPCHSGLA